MENYVSNGKLYLFTMKTIQKIILNWLTSGHMPVNEIKENAIASVNDLDNSDSYLASRPPLAPAKKTQNTSSEEDLDASLK
jgi:hypothetical protein